MQIVVGMEAETDPRLHIFIDKMEPVGHVVAVHASQRVHDIKGVGVQPVHPLHQLEQLDVGVKHGAHRLHEHLIALIHQNSGPAHRLRDLMLVEGQADALDPCPVIRSQLIRMQLLFPDGDHGHKHGGARPFGQNLLDFSDAAEEGAVLVLHHAGQEAAFDDVDPRLIQFIENGNDRFPPEFPVVDVAPVPQGAVQDLNAHSVSSPLSSFFCTTPRT